jgi:hypothetical protein
MEKDQYMGSIFGNHFRFLLMCGIDQSDFVGSQVVRIDIMPVLLVQLKEFIKD